jgi:hypothetical protein
MVSLRSVSNRITTGDAPILSGETRGLYLDQCNSQAGSIFLHLGWAADLKLEELVALIRDL